MAFKHERSFNLDWANGRSYSSGAGRLPEIFIEADDGGKEGPDFVHDQLDKDGLDHFLSVFVGVGQFLRRTEVVFANQINNFGDEIKGVVLCL